MSEKLGKPEEWSVYSHTSTGTHCSSWGSINPTAARQWWVRGAHWVYGPGAPEAEGEAWALWHKLDTAVTHRWRRVCEMCTVTGRLATEHVTSDAAVGRRQALGEVRERRSELNRKTDAGRCLCGARSLSWGEKRYLPKKITVIDGPRLSGCEYSTWVSR